MHSNHFSSETPNNSLCVQCTLENSILGYFACEKNHDKTSQTKEVLINSNEPNWKFLLLICQLTLFFWSIVRGTPFYHPRNTFSPNQLNAFESMWTVYVSNAEEIIQRFRMNCTHCDDKARIVDTTDTVATVSNTKCGKKNNQMKNGNENEEKNWSAWCSLRTRHISAIKQWSCEAGSERTLSSTTM